jgi:hypothetical protein
MLLTHWLNRKNHRSDWNRRVGRRLERASSRLRMTAEVVPLEERCLLSSATPLIPLPGNNVASPSDVMDYNYNGQGPGPKIPLIEMTFVNNTIRTVFPILYDSNTDANPAKPSTDLYDPIDPASESYRGYVGFSSGGQNYVGLPPGKTITINVPLVFWDAGRVAIAANGADMFPATTGTPNPYNFYFTDPLSGLTTVRYTVPAQSSNDNGVVMWYHDPTPPTAANPAGNPQIPAEDAPTQLTEMTIRVKSVLSQFPNVPSSQDVNLINYDVSYVDSMVLPVAMEAANVPVGNTGKSAPYGWIGANMTLAGMQYQINNFTSNTAKNGLGSYFGKGTHNGYTAFSIPTTTETKIPSGQSVVAYSPFSDSRSSYDNNRYMLTSGGVTGVQYGLSANSTQGSNKLTVPSGYIAALAKLSPGMIVTDSAPANNPDLQPGTTYLGRVPKTTNEIYISQKAIGTAPASGYSYTFTRPVSDYIVTGLLNLWYGWANYYAAHAQYVTHLNVPGNTTLNSNVLTFTTSIKGLVPGMPVTGPNLNPGTTILTVTAGKNGATSVGLSELPQSTLSGQYSFGALQPFTATGVTPLNLSFKSNQATAYSFAQNAYSVISAMSTIAVNPSSKESPAQQLLYNVIGGSIGSLNDIAPPAPLTPVIGTTLTDEIKSLLRGVTNFTTVSQASWYPNPAKPVAGSFINGQPAWFNVYNLDPFVWFVHKALKLSGYGFSLDDDVADVGANGATVLDFAIGGIQGLPNSAQWQRSLPYGPVHGTGTIDPQGKNGANAFITGMSPTLVGKLVATDPSTGQLGALVTGPGIQPGTYVYSAAGSTAVQLTKPVNPNAKAGTNTYYFSAP